MWSGHDSAPVTPLGQLVFFAQFLHAGGRWEEFCKEAPFGFTSPNAPTHKDVLGSLAFSILCGHTRYAHVNALPFDAVNPAMPGMKKVVSKDSSRRNLKKFDQIEARKWQRKHLRETWERLALRTMDVGYRHHNEDGFRASGGCGGRLQPA